MHRKPFVAALLVGAATLAPASARADGLPVPVDDAGPSGVAAADGSARFVTVYAGGRTVVERIALPGGSIAGQVTLHGRYTIPVVAVDGTAAGVSHDGGTLAVIVPRQSFPRVRTTLALLDARRMRVQRTLTLKGDFSFDALAPDGRTVYLIQYVDPTDPSNYRVRALDAQTGRLARRPIVDPDEDPDEMRGLPMTRAMSADGRWAYTLYNGNGEAPFIHALDTSTPRAVCIDLPASVAQLDLFKLKLRLTGTRLTVVAPNRPIADVDTRTFKVSAPARAKATGAARVMPSRNGPVPLAAIVAAAALALIAAGAAVRAGTHPRTPA